ncbi:MAG: hypothetical protein LH613_17125 [Chamaesiphon sp.]|nr:hypothetical protein [Chamaesiphon sp.]
MMLDFEVVNEDGTLPSTAEELSRILSFAAGRNAAKMDLPLSPDELMLAELIARPDEFSLETLEPAVLEGALYYSRFDRLFGTGGSGARIMLHDAFRDRVNSYQVENNISGLCKNRVKVGNLSVEYLDDEGQLTLLESDCLRLMEEVIRLWEFFVSVGATDRYDLFEELEDETRVNSTLSIIENFLPLVKSASLQAESKLWTLRSQDSWITTTVEKEYPDSIKICLNEDFSTDSCDWRYFILENRDQTRFPWR